MLARNETIFKWTLYALAALLCLLVQGAVLQRITLWGVLPAVYPLLPAIAGTYEDPTPAAIYGLCLGVVCDLLLPAPIPCFHTLIFPLVGLCASLLAQSVLPAGFLCSAAATAAAFLLTDVFRCLIFWATARPAWGTGLWLMLRELLISLPLSLPVTLLYRAVFRRTHMDD